MFTETSYVLVELICKCISLKYRVKAANGILFGVGGSPFDYCSLGIKVDGNFPNPALEGVHKLRILTPIKNHSLSYSYRVFAMALEDNSLHNSF